MASKKQGRGFDARQSILIVYVGIGVVAVILTIVIAFGEAPGTGSAQPTPTLTRTTSPLILTQQAEGSVNDTLRSTATRGPSSGGAVEPDSEVFIPTATATAQR